MSGHSKWATIKRKKGSIDAERSKIFQKLTKELYVAAKSGDKDPNNNANLRMVIEKAKGENMPKDNIQKAIDKAHGSNNGEVFEAIRYEGYGPGGIAIMIDCLTDNRNRTAPMVRSTLTKRGGNLGTDGSVAYLFERKGIMILENKYPEEELMLISIDLGALDFVVSDDGYEIYTKPEDFIAIKDGLIKNGYTDFIMSEVTFMPKTYVSLNEELTERAVSLIEQLEDIEDVQNVYHNLNV